MRQGDIVKYRIFPHEELHTSGMIGLVLSEPQAAEDEYGELVTVDVMWSHNRITSLSPLNITWDYVDELEVIQ